MLSVIRQQHELVSYASLPKDVVRLFGTKHISVNFETILSGLLVLSVAWLSFAVARGRDWIAACGWAMVAAIITATWFLSWYTLWPLAFAAVARDRRLVTVTFVLQGFFIAHHLGHFTT
jgi:hypothetical protein